MHSSSSGRTPTNSRPSSTHSGVSISHKFPIHGRDDPEKAIEPGESPLAREPTFSSVHTSGTNNPGFEVDWDDENDSMNPKNWPLWYKGLTIGFISWSTWCVVVYSTSYTTGLPEMQADFHISSEPVVTLGVTFYREHHCCNASCAEDRRCVLIVCLVIGLAIGTMILAPVSEMYGRRPVYIVSMLIFTLLIIPCGVATSLAEVVVVRFFGALAGSAMIAISPGSVSDIATDEYRALAFSIWSIGPLNGPTFGPIIGGFVTQ